MGFLTGNTIGDRRQHLQTLMLDRKFEAKERDLENEIKRTTEQIYQMHQRSAQLEEQIGQITLALSNPQYEVRWKEFEGKKVQLEEDLERLAKKEINEARQLLDDLEKLRATVRKEEKFDRRAA